MPFIGSHGAWQGGERLDEGARAAVQRAESAAAAYGMRQATPDVLLRALLDDPDGVPARALTAAGVDVETLRASLGDSLKRGKPPLGGRSALDADTREAIVLGTNEARRDGGEQAGARLLARQGANVATLRPLVQGMQAGGEEGSASAALFAASFPRFLAQVGGAMACPTCGAPLHNSFYYCYNCGTAL